MTRIGLIEDNLDYRAEVAFHLRRSGFEIALESDGRNIDAQLAHCPCDLLVLDLGLPVEDGLTIARRLRQKQPSLGIVMLTARGSLHDRLSGLEQGADAYLVKPVDMRELLATLRSVQRRLLPGMLPGIQPDSVWTLLPTSLSLRAPDGAVIDLTTMEFQLLKCLAAAAPEPVERAALVAAIGYSPFDFIERRLEVAFSRLRRKIEGQVIGSAPTIRALRHRGYVFAAPIVVSDA